jgi:hypothetical protein
MHDPFDPATTAYDPATAATPPAAPPAAPLAYPPAPLAVGAPQPEPRRTGLLVAIGVVAALLVVAGGLLLVGPFRTASSTDAVDASLRSGRAPIAGDPTTTGAEVPTSLADAPEAPGTPDLPEAPDAPAPAPVPVGSPSPAPSGGSNGGSNGAPTTPQPPAPTAPAPVITSFTTPESIDCHNGDFQTFSASWTTTNATKTMISIDGPGGYKTYGPNASDSLPFNCSSAHTFLLTATGHDGTTVTRSITLQPRNVQTPDAGDDEGDPATDPAPASMPDDER